MAVSIASSRSAASAIASFFFPEEPLAPPTTWPNRFAGRAPRAREQILRRRDLRRGDRPADSHLSRRTGSGRASTSRVIDGTVNRRRRDWSAAAARSLRRLQTGSVRVSAASLFLGVVLLIAGASYYAVALSLTTKDTMDTRFNLENQRVVLRVLCPLWWMSVDDVSDPHLLASSADCRCHPAALRQGR